VNCMVEIAYMHGFPLVYSPYAAIFTGAFVTIVFVVLLWTLVLKGVALWFAARGGQKRWFIALLVINTGGILEIVYLIWFRAPKPLAGESAPIISSSVQS
jgi:Family of unknown function (DUF5652)